jgi:ribosomal protein S20
MSISAISSGSLSYLSELFLTSNSTALTSSTSTSGSASTTDTFSSTLSELESAIKSGDLNSANKYLTEIEESNPQGSKNGTDPIGTFLSSVEKALSTGDISSAQTALTTFESAKAPDSSSQGGLGKELSQLESDIKSGNLTAAAKDLAQIQSHSPSSTTSSTSTSSSSTSSSDPIATFLKNVEAAISSGSIAAAQSALGTFQSQSYSSSLFSSDSSNSTISLSA